MKVTEGDVIKFGRVRFMIKRLVVDPSDVKEEDLEKSLKSSWRQNSIDDMGYASGS